MKTFLKWSLGALLYLALVSLVSYSMRPADENHSKLNNNIEGLCSSMRLVDGDLRVAFARKLREDLTVANNPQALTQSNKECAYEAQRITGVQ